nr:hypothetical protein [Tanacetum cinerariifolium]
MNYFQDHEWYDELTDSSLKEDALKRNAICEKSWGDSSQSVINFFTWLKTCFENFHVLDYELLEKIQDYWWKINDHECSLFANWRDHIHGPYTHINTLYDPYLDERNGSANNNSDIQEEEELHKNEERCELFDNPSQKPPICRVRRFGIRRIHAHDMAYLINLTRPRWKEFDNVGGVSII